MKAGKVARCDNCIKMLRQAMPGSKRKRNSNGSSKSRKNRQSYEDSTDDEDDDIAVAGVMKVWFLLKGPGPLVAILIARTARHHVLWRGFA